MLPGFVFSGKAAVVCAGLAANGGQGGARPRRGGDKGGPEGRHKEHRFIKELHREQSVKKVDTTFSSTGKQIRGGFLA